MFTVFQVDRFTSTFTAKFKTSGMYIFGITEGYKPLELKVQLFPYDFHEPMLEAINQGRETKPRIDTGFGTRHRFSCRPKMNGADEGKFFEFRYDGPNDEFFLIDLREQEIRNLLTLMRKYMTE